MPMTPAMISTTRQTARATAGLTFMIWLLGVCDTRVGDVELDVSAVHVHPPVAGVQAVVVAAERGVRLSEDGRALEPLGMAVEERQVRALHVAGRDAAGGGRGVRNV